MECLTAQEAAQRLGVSEVTIRRRIKRGELEAEKEPTAQGYEWRVLQPVTLELPPHADTAAQTVGLDGGKEATALEGTISVLERGLASRNEEIDRRLQLLSREQEITRTAQLALPATTSREEASAQSSPNQRSGSLRWWPRLVSRLASA
jgi:excisionase family DNA binding protein